MRFLSVICIAMLCMYSGASASGKVIATLEDVKGEVVVWRLLKPVPVENGMELRRKDRIKTGANGTVTIDYIETSTLGNGTLKLYENTRFRFPPSNEPAALDRGNILFAGRPFKQGQTFRVRTPTAVAGVRGTTFKQSVDPVGATTVEVYEGRVDVVMPGGDVYQVMPGQIAVLTKQSTKPRLKKMSESKRKAGAKRGRAVKKATKSRESKRASATKTGAKSSTGSNAKAGNSSGQQTGQKETVQDSSSEPSQSKSSVGSAEESQAESKPVVAQSSPQDSGAGAIDTDTSIAIETPEVQQPVIEVPEVDTSVVTEIQNTVSEIQQTVQEVNEEVATQQRGFVIPPAPQK